MLTLAEEKEQRLLTREEIKAYANWLNSYSWHWYAILTFRYPISLRRAWKLFNYWKISLKKDSGNRISYFMVVELDTWRVHPHLHVFLSGTADEKPYLWEQEWFSTAGIAKIAEYNHSLGASYYLSEKLKDGKADIKFSQELPQRISEEGCRINESDVLCNVK